MRPSMEPFHIMPGDEATDWESLREGVRIRRLHRHPHTGYEVALLCYEPGARVPRHHHSGDEHVYVLSGSQQDERGRYPAGSYVFNAAGSRHEVFSEDGCLVLIHWLEPVQFCADSEDPA